MALLFAFTQRCGVAPTQMVSDCGRFYPPLGEARFYRNLRLWQDGIHRCNVVLASVQGAKESWAVITDEQPSLQTLWQYALRFRVEELLME